MIVNAIVVFAMRNCQDHEVKKQIIQAFIFQFVLHIIVLLRPQVPLTWHVIGGMSLSVGIDVAKTV